MRQSGWGLFRLGLKRRKKEVRRMRLMMCLAVFFLAFTFLFQDNMNGYQMTVNYDAFGQWIACSESGTLAAHPYLEEGGSISRGSKVYCLRPREKQFSAVGWSDPDAWNIRSEDTVGVPEAINQPRSDTSRDSGSFLGTLSPGMAERNHIELIEGRFPENDGEIAMEIPVLDALGQGYEIGSEISFYLAGFDDSALLDQLVDRYIKSLNGEVAEDDDDSIRYDYDVTKIPGRNELRLVKYTLVGTIQRYSSRWDTEMSGGESGNLPGAIVTQQEFDRLGMSKRTYRFFDLKPEYRTQDIWRFATELMDSIESSEKYENVSFALNRNAYNNPLWGNSVMYRSITILLIVISSCIITYLMVNYLSKRREFFLRLREIGATAADVWKMSAYECVGSLLPAAVLTFALTYLLSVIVVFVIAKAKGIGFFYVFSLRTMVTILLAAVLTIGISLLAALALFGGRAPGAKSKVLSHSAARRLKRCAAKMQRKQSRAKPYLGLLETLRRDRIAHRFKNRLLAAISIFVCAIVIFCVAKTVQPTRECFELEENACDFQGEMLTQIRNVNVRVPIAGYWDGHQIIKYEKARWTGDGIAARAVISAEAVECISSLPGVNAIEWRDRDYTHLMSFEGKDDDAFFQTYLNTFLVNNQPYLGVYELDLSHSFASIFIKALERDFYAVLCKQNAEEYWRRYEAYLDPAVADLGAFLRGEQIIAVVDTEMTRAKQRRAYPLQFDWGVGEEAMDVAFDRKAANLLTPERGAEKSGDWYGYPASFAPGDKVAVLCKGEQEIKATVAGVVPLSKSGFGYDDERFLTLLGADAFQRRVCEADGFEWGYNSFEADLDAISANERLVNDLVDVCAEYGVRYDNNLVNKTERRVEMIHAVATYGFFALMLAVLFFFVISCIAKDEEARLSEKYRILSRFGMTAGQMAREKRLDALRRVWPIVLALPAQMLIRFGADLKVNLAQIKAWSYLYAHTRHPAPNPAYDTTPLMFTLRLLWDCANFKLACVVIGTFALICWLIVSRIDKEWRKAL